MQIGANAFEQNKRHGRLEVRMAMAHRCYGGVILRGCVAALCALHVRLENFSPESVAWTWKAVYRRGAWHLAADDGRPTRRVARRRARCRRRPGV